MLTPDREPDAEPVTFADAITEQVWRRWELTPLHNPDQISEALGLVTDENVWNKAAHQINGWLHRRTAYKGDGIKKQFRAIVERQHKIAHYADLEDWTPQAAQAHHERRGHRCGRMDRAHRLALAKALDASTEQQA